MAVTSNEFAQPFLAWRRIGDGRSVAGAILKAAANKHADRLDTVVAMANTRTVKIGALSMKQHAHIIPKQLGSAESWVALLCDRRVIAARPDEVLAVRNKLAEGAAIAEAELSTGHLQFNAGTLRYGFDHLYVPPRNLPLGHLWFPSEI